MSDHEEKSDDEKKAARLAAYHAGIDEAVEAVNRMIIEDVDCFLRMLTPYARDRLLAEARRGR